LNYHNLLIKKINSYNAKICIVGLGYVGLPLLIHLGKKRFNLIGYDRDVKKIDNLNRGISYISNIKDKTIKGLSKSKKIYFSSNEKSLGDADVIICCLPTPIKKNKSPDMTYIKDFSLLIKKSVKRGQLIILESTTYPGTSENYIVSICKKKKLEIGKDVFVGYSPEREDPGNKKFSLSNTPKVVSGFTKRCLMLCKTLYSKISSQTVEVKDLKTAEAVKIYENIFRSINISLVNEMHIILSKLKINIYDVIKAAKTKPFGFMPFYPGPGLGGHCIPIDPHLINWVAKSKGYSSKFIELSAQINRERINKIFKFIFSYLSKSKFKKKNIKILIIGVAYKKNTNDCRESPALKLIEILNKKKIKFDFYDPFVKELKYFRMYGPLNQKGLTNLEKINQYSCSIILTDHDIIDYKKILKKSNLIFDTRGIYNSFKSKKIINFSF
tara:strand:- start:5223 stop:6545 length:1323 start_codon:yes stop_codon:yes gene_type:complete